MLDDHNDTDSNNLVHSTNHQHNNQFDSMPPSLTLSKIRSLKVSERSERALRKTSKRAYSRWIFAKWLQTATSTTELTLFHSIRLLASLVLQSQALMGAVRSGCEISTVALSCIFFER